jgi:NAD(P)-dependent dehydrogenase (short-subunit alcohol dehydrogenase family)
VGQPTEHREEGVEDFRQQRVRDGRAVTSPARENADHCRSIVKTALSELGGIDILVHNAAH